VVEAGDLEALTAAGREIGELVRNPVAARG
jgi:hypothetical protein